MIRTFWVLVLLLSLLVGGVVVHYLRSDAQAALRPLVALSGLSRCAGLSLGRSYAEPVRRCAMQPAAYGNLVYPEMQPIDSMGFVYAK